MCKEGTEGLKESITTLFSLSLLLSVLPIPSLLSLLPASRYNFSVPRDYYDILGLSKGASADEVKKAYRKLSKELHPDRHKGEKGAEAKFKEVNEAYEVLSNPEKKQRYDQFGAAGVNGGPGGGGFGGFDFSGFSNAQGFDLGDLFEGFFGGGRRSGGRPQQERGADRETEMTIELSEAATGVHHTVEMRALRPCSDCDATGAEKGSKIVTCTECGGTGQVVRQSQSIFGMIQQASVCPKCRGSGKRAEKPCSRCQGEGRRGETVSITVDIPAGISDGQTLRIRGEGDAGRTGAPAGDLFVHIHVKSDVRFTREGDDLRSAVAISVPDAALGIEVPVETIHGPVQLKVPAGTQPKQVFRLKGKGMPVLQTSRHGDHYVTVDVLIPTKLSRDEKKLMEEWKNLR